jgi:hypothetical protein
MIYCGREFTDEEITLIKRLIVDNPGITRQKLSTTFCEKVGWRKADGTLRYELSGGISANAQGQPYTPSCSQELQQQ